MDTPPDELPAAPLLPPTLPAEKPPGPRIGKALLVCFIFYVVVFAVSIPIAIYFAVTKQTPDAMLITLAGQAVGWPVALWLGLVFIKRPWSGSYAIKGFPPSLLPGLIIGCFGLTIVLTHVAGLIPMPEAIKRAFMGLKGGNAVIFFVCISLIAPIAEELFFRGWMLRGFFANYSTTKSIWLTAVIFALFHLNPWQAAVALPLGLLFGWLVLRTGSLAPGIIGHFMVNSSTNYLLMPFAMLLGHDAEHLKHQDHLPWDLLAAGAVLSAVGLVWMGRVLKSSPHAPREASEGDASRGA